MSYKIMNTLLPTDQRDRMFFTTLDMLMKGQNLNKSPLAEWGRTTLSMGNWWYGCEKVKNKERCIRQRISKFIKLYHSINEKGYTKSPISIFFSEDGNVHVYDGFHRLCIMKYLKMRVKVNCVISKHDPNPARKGDFPLVKTVIEFNKGKNLYQPCDDPRLKTFKVWRRDSAKRLKYIRKRLVGKTVLDIGCSEGYFSRELAKKGFVVTALDLDRRRVAVTRYLSILNNLRLKYHVGRWQKYFKENLKLRFHNILFLSVFHHDMLRMKPSNAFTSLHLFKGRANRLFLECPLKSSEIKWLPKAKQKMWNISEDRFVKVIEDNTGMKLKDTWRKGVRPIFLLVKK